MTTPLQGVRVIDLSHVIAGPLASFYLAQLGADVIKIESPNGGDVSRAGGVKAQEGDTPTGFASINAGKSSLAVDIRDPRGAALVKQLVAEADVFIENFRPGVVEKYGLGEAALRALKPDLIYCSISGYGQAGEWAQRGAYDHVIQALTGMMMMSGDSGSDNAPLKVGFPVIDVATGMLGALSVMAALFQRARDGQGQRIDTSLLQGALMLMHPHASGVLTSGNQPPRVGNRGFSGSPTSDTYRCTDGWLSVGANTPAQFRKVVTELGMAELCEDGNALDLEAFNQPGGGFVVARDMPYLRQRLEAAFAGRSAGEMEQRLNAQGVPAARVRTLKQFLDEARGDSGACVDWRTFSQGQRQIATPGLGFVFGRDPLPVTAGAPSLGEQSEDILRRLGISEQQARELRDAKIVVGPTV